MEDAKKMKFTNFREQLVKVNSMREEIEGKYGGFFQTTQNSKEFEEFFKEFEMLEKMEKDLHK